MKSPVFSCRFAEFEAFEEFAEKKERTQILPDSLPPISTLTRFLSDATVLHLTHYTSAARFRSHFFCRYLQYPRIVLYTSSSITIPYTT